MLLYHFPLNTADNISNFTNVGLKNDYVVGSGFIQGDNGHISAISADTNSSVNSFVSISLLDYLRVSICMRVKIKGTMANNQALIWSKMSPTNTDASRLYAQSNQNSTVFNFHLPNSTSFQVNLSGSWFDLIIVKDGNRYSFYVNGVKKSEVEDSNIIENLYLCNRSLGGLYRCNALIQDIRIYDYALSKAEINEYSRALVVHYPLQGNELNGSVLKDVSGFGNDMQRYGGSSSYDNNSPRADKSLHLVNANQCYYQGDMKWSDYANFTISAWIYPTDSSNFRGVLGEHILNSSGFNYGIAFAQWQSGLLCFTIFSGYGTASVRFTPLSLNTDQWYHCVMTYDGSVGKLYIDGELQEELTKVVAPSLGTSITIGRAYNASNRYWDGNISDISIYATALSAEDIKNLYNSPISVSKQHQTMAFELKENPLYPSKYWRTPTYAEMYYMLFNRINASNLKTLGRVNVNGTYIKGCFLLPDDWVLPDGVTMTMTTANYTTNSYLLADFEKLEINGAVFCPLSAQRVGTTVSILNDNLQYKIANPKGRFIATAQYTTISAQIMDAINAYTGWSVRLCHSSQDSHSFSTSATTKIKFAKSNLQYHCTQHKWRFAEHSYDFIGLTNANLSDNYDGWIDLFGYGTSGVNYSPTLHSTDNADYPSENISNTDNDWGVNVIESYDYNVKNFAANKNGIVQHNELRENNSEVNGCYNDKLITNELIEN